jgi:hypothetical protein
MTAIKMATIQVSQADIDQSDPGDPLNNSAAKALKRWAIGNPNIRVLPHIAIVHLGRQTYMLDHQTAARLLAHKAGRQIGPYSFELVAL